MKNAARRRVVEKRALDVLARAKVEPLGSPLDELMRVAAEIVAMKDLLADEVTRLRSIARTDKTGREQTRATLEAFERSLDRAAKVLLDVSRLDLDARVERRDKILDQRTADDLESIINASLTAIAADEDTRALFWRTLVEGLMAREFTLPAALPAVAS